MEDREESSKIRDRYVRPGKDGQGTVIIYPRPIAFPEPVRDTDPKSLMFLIGFMFSVNPVPEPEWHDPVGTEILVCD